MNRTLQAALLCLLSIAIGCHEPETDRVMQDTGPTAPDSPAARLAAAEAAVARFAMGNPRRYRVLQPAQLRSTSDNVFFLHFTYGTFDPAKPLNIPPLLRKENARYWLVQFPDLPTEQEVRQRLQLIPPDLSLYGNGATWKIRPSRDLLQRLRAGKAAGWVRSLIPLHPLFKLDATVYQWILTGKLGKESPPPPPIYRGKRPTPFDLTPEKDQPNCRVEIWAHLDLRPTLEAMNIEYQCRLEDGTHLFFRPSHISQIVALARMPDVWMIAVYYEDHLLTSKSYCPSRAGGRWANRSASCLSHPVRGGGE